MRLINFALVGFVMSATGCGAAEDAVDSVPTRAEIDDAKVRVGLSADAVGQARALLELLGFMPKYTCGEARSTFAGKLPADLGASYAGATFAVDASNPAEDVVTVAFPAAGSTVAGQKVTGTMVVKTSGGTDRFALEVDARNVQVNGRTVQAVGGYRSCSDETAYWAEAQGTLPGSTATYQIDADVAKRAGAPVIGSTKLLINATGSITRAGATDTLALTEIDYEVGKLLPRSGTVVITTSGGHRIAATFRDDTPVAGQVSVKIDARSSVTVPLPGF